MLGACTQALLDIFVRDFLDSLLVYLGIQFFYIVRWFHKLILFVASVVTVTDFLV